jgi:hypothetical protein
MLFSILTVTGALLGMCAIAYRRYAYLRARSGAVPRPVVASRY